MKFTKFDLIAYEYGNLLNIKGFQTYFHLIKNIMPNKIFINGNKSTHVNVSDEGHLKKAYLYVP